VLKYKVSMTEPNTHYFDVNLQLIDFRKHISDPRKLKVKMPVWTPGSYLVREFSRNVLDVTARNLDTGSQLRCEKASKNEWVIDADAAQGISVQYKVYAFEFTVDTSYMDNFHAIINGASVFLYVEGLENTEGTLELVPFNQWRDISTGLDKKLGSTREFSFPNYDILIDSPIELGNLDIQNFIIGGTSYEVSIFSPVVMDFRAFTEDLKRIVETTEKVFRDIPYRRYVFIVDFAADNSFGGLEHLNSTHCIASILKLDPPEEYHKLLSLFSHEFFHAWNVKRMRPMGLGPFDYMHEVYTKSLWIAEGVTSYYDDLLIRRAGIFTVGEYLDAFSENLSQMKTLPGSRSQSAQESSFDSWIKFYRQNENSPNVIFSYYTQGAVIGWMLDMEIKKSTELAKSLDDAMRLTYHDTYLADGRGYTDEEFERACLQVTDSHCIKQIFDERVMGRSEVDYDKYLGYAGLKLVPKKEEKEAGFLGVRVREESGRVLVTTVLARSPAEQAGLSASDEIIAVDDFRVDKQRLAFYLANRHPSTKATLTVSRQGTLSNLQAVLSDKPTMEYRVIKKDSASEKDKALFRSWLNADWSEEIAYTDHRTLQTRPNLLEYI
jgi:predicted metalloprotease with PDZ domain